MAVAEYLESIDVKVEILGFHDRAFDGVFQVQKGWGIR
jgi:hypothetical protein